MRLVLLVVAFALTGCAGSVQTLRPATDLAEARRQLDGQSTEVYLRDGRIRAAHALRVDADTTSWVDPQTAAFVRVPTSSIVEVRRTDRRGSVRRAAARGAVAAGLVGAVLGGIAGYDGFNLCFWGPCEPPSTGERIRGAAVGALAVGGIGATYGTAVGALFGTVGAPEDRYLFVGPDEEPPGSPPGWSTTCRPRWARAGRTGVPARR